MAVQTQLHKLHHWQNDVKGQEAVLPLKKVQSDIIVASAEKASGSKFHTKREDFFGPKPDMSGLELRFYTIHL